MEREEGGIMKICLGALAPGIAKQLDEQGISYDPKVIEFIQKDADAITRLVVRGFISTSVTQYARKKLIRKMQEALTVPARGEEV